MRDYVKGVYGEYIEQNIPLSLTLTLKIWRRDMHGFDQAVAELDKDVRDAGAPWTGRVSVGPMKRWWLFGDLDGVPLIQLMLETFYHGTSQASNAFSSLIEDQLREESPRSDGYNSATEKPKARRGSR